MVAASTLTYFLARDRVISHLDGVIFLALIVGYVILSVSQARREGRDLRPSGTLGGAAALPVSQPQAVTKIEEDSATSATAPVASRTRGALLASPIGYAVLVVLGVAILMLGAKLFVDGAVELALAWGVSELVIAVTLVAAGTSLPEAATSIMAGLRGRRDIAIGNVVGSNIFNLLAILGLGALVAKKGIDVAPEALRTDLPVMIGVAVACLPIFFSRGTVSRAEGALLLIYYLIYTANLALAVTHSPWFVPFRNTVFFGVFPLTAVFLVIGYLRSRGRQPSWQGGETA